MLSKTVPSLQLQVVSHWPIVPRRILQQPHNRRCLSTSARKRPIGRPSLPVTKKERLRSLEAPANTTVEEFIDRATINLTFLQTRLLSFWRKDGDPRPARKGTKMDHRWWFWSLNMALLPAYCIALYCEFIGEPAMKIYHAKKMDEQRRKALGLDFDEAEELELLKKISPTGGMNTTTDKEGDPVKSSPKGEAQSSTPITTEALVERVNTLETQLLLLRAAERRRMQRAYQSDVQNRLQDQTLLDVLHERDETSMPEELGPLDRAMIRLAESSHNFINFVKEGGSYMVKVIWEGHSPREARQANQGMSGVLPPLPEEKTIDAVDDASQFVYQATIPSADSQAVAATESSELATKVVKAAEQAAGVQEHQPDVWSKTWAVITGASPGPNDG